MKSANNAIALCGILLGVCETNAGTQPVLQPTPLEAFKDEEFRFPRREAARLSLAISRALEQLQGFSGGGR